jgi:Tfp pilus assembly protein PilF
VQQTVLEKPKATSSTHSGRPTPTWLVILVLVLAICAAYSGLTSCGFVILDDSSHIYENATVARGLTWEGMRSVFTTPHASLWVPLTTLSFMNDVSVFGGNPTVMHLENLAWHCLATILLFVALRRLTGELWPSAFAAAVFGLHPINVESVAWLTERKNVLCASLSFAALACWAQYAKQPRARWWIAAVGMFSLALLAKPMTVPLPFALLLLDTWPLSRWGRIPKWKLIAEKVPFFVLSFASSRMTLWATAPRNSVASFNELSLSARLTNAFVSTGEYLRDLFLPSEFAVIYPHPGVARWVPAILAAVVLAIITLIAWRIRRSHPWILVGWLIFGGMLMPSLGLVQVGSQSRADRFVYFAQVGLWIAVAWTACRNWPARYAKARAFVAGAVLLALASLTVRQVGAWTDSVTLFQQSLKVTGPHPQILDLLAEAYSKRKEPKIAVAYWLKSIQMAPNGAANWLKIGAAMDELSDLPRAREAFRRAAAIEPQNIEAVMGLASVAEHSGEFPQAERYYARVLELEPANASAREHLAHLRGDKNDAANDQRKSRDPIEGRVTGS